MYEVYQEEILAQVAEAEFMAVLGDETTDVENHIQYVIVIRYVLPNGDVTERFWGFFRPEGQDATTLADITKKELHILLPNAPEKLVAQGYDGASVMSGVHSGVQAQVRQEFVNAWYIHCRAHQFNLMAQKAASTIARPRKFFSSLNSIPVFFARSPQRLAALDACVAKRVPSATPLRWNYLSRTVQMVYSNREVLKECFAKLSVNRKSTDATVTQATALHIIMRDGEFQFWLEFFSRIMPHVDLFYAQLQTKQTDATRVKRCTSNFINAVQKKRDEMAESPAEDALQPMEKRRRIAVSQSRRHAAIGVLDCIIHTTKERFETVDHLTASCLIDPTQFELFSTQFPTKMLDTTATFFPQLKKAALKSELILLYEKEEFRQAEGAVALLKFIISEGLDCIFSETVKLIKIVITMPMSTAEAERCFSTLKRIKTFLRNTMDQDRLNALAVLTIEKSLLLRMPNFNEKVIKKFASKKDRRIPLFHK
ncbi:hypothetical protein B566_EDAN017765 [Ephemera danica]|nr:hypothetical protein B566_EDAN017765 [Ephemera danica]